jgi:hypothetical protein
MSLHGNLLGPEPTLLPADDVVDDALAGGTDPAEVAAAHPAASAPWAALAEAALADGQPVAAYAYARTGYHRGLDALRKNGWKGFGPVPWDHRPNQGFLRAVAALSRAASVIGEEHEAVRCYGLLVESDPKAPSVLGLD